MNLPAGNKTPKTTTGVATRIVRSTAVSTAVKKLYDDYCQDCDTRLEVPGGTLSEGAHIRAFRETPLRARCTGERSLSVPQPPRPIDGGIYVGDDLKVRDHTGAVLGPLSKTSKHPIGVEHVQYHRKPWAH